MLDTSSITMQTTVSKKIKKEETGESEEKFHRDSHGSGAEGRGKWGGKLGT